MESEETETRASVTPEAQSGQAAQRRFWLTHMRIGFGVFLAETVVVLAYLALTPHNPHRPVLWIVVSLWFVIALLGIALAPTVASKPWRATYSVAWTVLSAFAVAGVTILDLGPNSPILVLLFLPLIYAALMFTPKAAALCGLSALASAALVATTDSEGAITQERSFMFFAVLAGASVLCVAASVNRSRIERHERQLLDTIALLAATDELTGCAVRRVFRQRVEEEIARALRGDRRLSLMMIDVDQFKSVNDTYGHLVGDRLLAAVGAVLRANVRSFDMVGRLGGDEFAIVLPDAQPSEAVALAERIRQSVAVAIEVPVTVSVGVSGLDQYVPTVEQLFDDADFALYEVKRAGRDGVAVRGPAPSLRSS